MSGDYTPAQIAEYRQWCDAEFARGVCPWSGSPVHSCHRGVCDCWDAEDCAVCVQERPPATEPAVSVTPVRYTGDPS